MVTFFVFYPYSKDKKFDMDYYISHHVKMIKDRLGDRIKALSVDKGLNGFIPDTDPPFFAILRITLGSLEDLAVLGAMAPELVADAANYTDTNMLAQVSEIIE